MSGLPPLQAARAAAATAAAAAAAAATASTAGQNKAFERAVHAGVAARSFAPGSALARAPKSLGATSAPRYTAAPTAEN